MIDPFINAFTRFKAHKLKPLQTLPYPLPPQQAHLVPRPPCNRRLTVHPEVKPPTQANMNLPSLNRFGDMARIHAAETESSEKSVQAVVALIPSFSSVPLTEGLTDVTLVGNWLWAPTRRASAKKKKRRPN